jgi:hypothetical protein
MAKRNKAASFFLMPFMAFVWIFGWIFYYMGSLNLVDKFRKKSVQSEACSQSTFNKVRSGPCSAVNCQIRSVKGAPGKFNGALGQRNVHKSKRIASV